MRAEGDWDVRLARTRKRWINSGRVASVASRWPVKYSAGPVQQKKEPALLPSCATSLHRPPRSTDGAHLACLEAGHGGLLGIDHAEILDDLELPVAGLGNVHVHANMVLAGHHFCRDHPGFRRSSRVRAPR